MRKKYPHHYLWSNYIFDTDAYKQFEQELTHNIAQNDDKFKMGQHLEVLMPEIAAVMKTGFKIDCQHFDHNAI